MAASSEGAMQFEEFDGPDEILFFGAHVPNILLHRCIQSIYEKKNIPDRSEPFLERFEGSLLFVDISGFTSLSRYLHVEALKTYINAYFTKMLDVVDKYGGNVAKFAGDALYIKWPATAAVTLEFCVKMAFLCSDEITSVCNNYAVSLKESGEERSMGEEHSLASSTSTPSPTCYDNQIIYMNVHSGISVGIMAVVDVGCNGRWEMLFLGKPLTDVATAGNQAKSGEIMLSSEAYHILTNNGLLDSIGTYSSEKRAQDCYAIYQFRELVNFENSDHSFHEEHSHWQGGKNMLVGALLHEEYSSFKGSKVSFSDWLLEKRQVLAKQYIMDSIKV